MPAVHPRAGLGRVLDDLGRTVLDLVLGDPDAVPDLGGVAIYDPYDEPALTASSIVLGVGVHDPAEVAALLRRLGKDGAAALMVRAPVEVDDEVRLAARQSGVALLGLAPGAAWTQVATLLRSLLDDVVVAESAESLGGAPAGDLFALANAVSSLLDAPVTIEDRSSRVLAFSGNQDEADESRIATILGRQVPERFTRKLAECGVFRELYRSERPVFVPAERLGDPDVELSRVAVAVRAGDEVLGSMWAAVRRPLSEERETAFLDSAKLVALHLLRQRAGADVQRRLRADLLATVLEGGPGAADAAGRLGITDTQSVVLAVGGLDEDEAGPAASLEAGRQRMADTLALHLSAVHPRAAAALVGGVAYGIVPVPGEGTDPVSRATRVAQQFLDRAGDRLRVAVGVGRVAADLAGLTRSRTDADRALRVLRRPGAAPRAAPLSDDVHLAALLLEFGDLVAAEGHGPFGALARLSTYDREHACDLVPTLAAWLDAFGDVTVAAQQVHVHPNTFRYRLRRIADVAGLDLDDPDARFAAMLQLRLLGSAADRGSRRLPVASPTFTRSTGRGKVRPTE